jgi:hypothetical protein
MVIELSNDEDPEPENHLPEQPDQSNPAPERLETSASSSTSSKMSSERPETSSEMPNTTSAPTKTLSGRPETSSEKSATSSVPPEASLERPETSSERSKTTSAQPERPETSSERPKISSTLTSPNPYSEVKFSKEGQNIAIYLPVLKPGQSETKFRVPLQTLQNLKSGQGIPTGRPCELLVKVDDKYHIFTTKIALNSAERSSSDPKMVAAATKDSKTEVDLKTAARDTKSTTTTTKDPKTEKQKTAATATKDPIRIKIYDWKNSSSLAKVRLEPDQSASPNNVVVVDKPSEIGGDSSEKTSKNVVDGKPSKINDDSSKNTANSNDGEGSVKRKSERSDDEVKDHKKARFVFQQLNHNTLL